MPSPGNTDQRRSGSAEAEVATLAVGPAIDRGGREPLTAFSYVMAQQGDEYRLVMGLFAEHKRRFGLRLSPRDVHGLWAERPATRPRSIGSSCCWTGCYEWGAVDRHADTGRASSTAEFKRARNTYDITAAGEHVQATVEQVLRLGQQTATLGQHRLRRLVELVEELRERGRPAVTARAPRWSACARRSPRRCRESRPSCATSAGS